MKVWAVVSSSDEEESLGFRAAEGGSAQLDNGRGHGVAHHWSRWLFPNPPRRVPRERAWNVGLRTLHLMAFGVLLGGHFWNVQPELLLPALGMTLASGAALMGLELYKSFEWFFLGKGLIVLAKLALLLSVLRFWEARVPLLFAVVTLASIGAHMPARYRYYSILHRRVHQPEVVSLVRGHCPL